MSLNVRRLPFRRADLSTLTTGNVQTQPFSEDLHQRVLTYQNQLFEAREENIRKRREEPEMAASVRRLCKSLSYSRLTLFDSQVVTDVINEDTTHLAQLEAAKVVFPEEREPAPAPRGRKSVGGTRSELEQ